ncbi:MAG: GTPase, partial [Clostridia bacterium]|nr:GTPase [Clostridia bacterium]
FGFEVNKSVITALLSSTIGSSGATILGRTVVAEIAKLLPGAGTIAGTAISATTAGVITTALGEAYLGILSLVFSGEMVLDDLSTKKGKSKMNELFQNALKKPLKDEN